MAAKGEWNIPNYELEKLAHYFLELITEQNENKNNDKNQDNKIKNKAGINPALRL